MKILCIMTVYNEREMLPYKKEWCRKNGLDLYVIDNYSTDYTKGWLEMQKINHHQIDTDGAFDLRILQKEIIKTTHKIKPDWVIYNGADLFIFAEKPLVHLCMDAEDKDKNVIGFPMIDICRVDTSWMFKNYYYRPARDNIEFVYKYDPKVRYSADNVIVPNRKTWHPPGVMINYGRIKTVKQRKELLKRRKKAWKKGLDKRYGRHYLREQTKGWSFNKDELSDIRESKYWQYLKDYV